MNSTSPSDCLIPEVGRTPPARELTLSAGRTVVVVPNGTGQDEIQVRSPRGEIEVRITLTESGPVVRLQATRLELESVEDMDLSCRRFNLHAREEARLVSDGQLRFFAAEQLLLRAKKDMDLKGRPIRYNVRDGRFYDDYVPSVNGEHWGSAFAGVPLQQQPAENQAPVSDLAETLDSQLQRFQVEIERFDEILRATRPAPGL